MSACPTCLPPDEGEIRLQGRVAAIQAELDRAVGEIRKAFNVARKTGLDNCAAFVADTNDASISLSDVVLGASREVAKWKQLHSDEYKRATVLASVVADLAESLEKRVERNHALECRLIALASYAATARDENTSEWMIGLMGHLNKAAELVAPSQVFVYHKAMATEEMWFTVSEIP